MSLWTLVFGPGNLRPPRRFGERLRKSLDRGGSAAILPIDLQTLFAQISNVGREQAVQRDVPPLQQTLQGTQIVLETQRHERSVNETNDSREGERVTDEREGSGGAKEEPKKRRGAKEPSDGSADETAGRNEIFRDPDLGTHIDVVR